MTMPPGPGPLSPPSYARIGDVIAGKYRVERVLGRGGMGIVVAASHVALRQVVAIKFLLPSSRGELHLAARLLREARAVAALKGEHVARVFDVDTVDGAPYIVMEYLEGHTLALQLETEGPLAPMTTVDYALEACEALAEAHALGIVHRDLKPSNLFLARTPGGRLTLRVLDFGISKALDDRGDVTFDARLGENLRGDSISSGTDSHALVGSPPYVSPEQLLRPRDIDARSDIWSLGVVLYQCLTGRLPFQGETLPRLWDSILRQPVPPFGDGDRPLSPELERTVGRCLEKDPLCRYAGVGELARELAPLGSARARDSLEVIEGLSADGAPAPRRVRSVNGESSAPEQHTTLTDAPTTREPTPDASVALPEGGWQPHAGTIMLAATVLAGGLFVALRPMAQDEPPSRPQANLPVLVPSATADQPPRPSEAPKEEPAPAIAAVAASPEKVRRPSLRIAQPLARATASSREPTATEPPLAASSSGAKPPALDVLAQAEEILGKGQISEACAVGQVAARTAPDSPRVLEFLGRCYMRLGSVEQARSYYRRYLELNPSAPNAAFVRAMLDPKPR